jgi:hypothetical protein
MATPITVANQFFYGEMDYEVNGKTQNRLDTNRKEE